MSVIPAQPLAVPLHNPASQLNRAARLGWLPWTALLGGNALIAFSALFVKWAGLGGVTGPVAAFYRLAVGSLILCPWMFLRRPRSQRMSRQDLLLATAAGLLFAGDLTLWNSSLLQVPAATAALLANSSPLWVALLLWWVAKETLGPRFWIGMLLALGGSATILGNAWGHLGLSTGCFMAIGASLFYGGYLFVAGRARRALDTLRFMTLMTASGAVAMLVLCWALQLPLLGFTAQGWLALVALGLFTHVCGWFAVSYALGHISAGPVSVVLLGQAPMTALFAVYFFNEPVQWNHLVGGSAILAGIYLAVQRHRPGQDQVDEGTGNTDG